MQEKDTLSSESKRNYIDNAILHEELAAYAKRMRDAQEEARKKGEDPRKVPKLISNRLAGMFEIIVKRLGSSHRFNGYPYLEDMQSEAMLNIVSYAHAYNPEKTTNAFGYITTVAFRSFAKYISKEKKHLADVLRFTRDQGGWMRDVTEDWLDAYETAEAKKEQAKKEKKEAS